MNPGSHNDSDTLREVHDFTQRGARFLNAAWSPVRLGMYRECIQSTSRDIRVEPRRAFRWALKKARIEEFHFHGLRHTFATRLVQAGVELYRVQQLLGHKSPMMTQRYAHHYPESLRDGVEVLDRLKPVSHFITVGSGGRGVEAVSV